MTTPSYVNVPIGARTLRRLCTHCALPVPKGKTRHEYCTKQILNREYRARERELGTLIGERVWAYIEGAR